MQKIVEITRLWDGAIKTIYDVVERPAPDKVNGKFRVEIYVDGGQMVMSCVYTGTRY